MKRTGKLLAIVLTLALALPAGLTVFAEDTMVISPVVKEFVSSDATVQDITETEDGYRITVKTVYEPVQTVILLTDVLTAIVDNESGRAMTADQLKAGDHIVAYYAPTLKEDTPTYSRAIVANIKPDTTVARYMTVGKVEEHTDGHIRISSAEGDYIITIQPETPQIWAYTCAQANFSEYKKGVRMFAWFDIMLMSYPAQAGADRVSLFQPIPRKVEKITVRDQIKVNGEIIDISATPIFTENGAAMIPVRTVFEKLGFKVTWTETGKVQTVGLDDGTVKTTITLGQDSYYKASSKAIGLTQAISLGAAPKLVKDKTYAPSELINLLYSRTDTITVEDGMMCVTSK